MRGENGPAVGGRSAADGGSVEDARVEPIQPGERADSRLTASAPAPGWTRRLSLRDKAGRALVVALAVTVALAVLLPRSTITLPPQITRLLTPVPTRAPTPPPFATGAFERVPLPVDPGADTTWLTPSPRDPATAFVCAFPRPDPVSGPVSGAISLWVTHNAGQFWSRAPLPEVRGKYCEVHAAADGSQRVAMSTEDGGLDQTAQEACAHSRFFLSDDGATWRSIAHTSLAPPISGGGGGCYFPLVTATHVFVVTATGIVNNMGEWLSILERSDDEGQTWQRADHGLPDGADGGSVQLLDATGDALFTLVSTSGGTATTAVPAEIWVTHDAGASWRRAEAVTWPTPPRGSDPIDELLTEAPLGALASAPRACHCVVGLSHPNSAAPTPSLLIGEHLYLSRDLTQWTPLPPLPVKGASAERSGVYQVLGLTGDGRLLVVGASLEEGVPESLDAVGVSHTPPRLWAWNTHTRRWELAPTQLPCPNLLFCYDAFAIGYNAPGAVSIHLDGNGRLAETVLWVVLRGEPGEKGLFVPTWYHLSIPAA